MAVQLSTEYEALKHDVTLLFNRFAVHQSVRFEDFCKEWRVMNFNSIFSTTYRNVPHAKIRLTERLLRVASEFLSSQSTFLFRVAAIYMFYAVYFKQITEQKVKIRMTPTMWKDLMDFLNVLIEHQHLDVAYILLKLRDEGAFLFTAFPKELAFGRHEFMIGVESMFNFRMTYEADKYTSELLENIFSDSLVQIQNEYQDVKQKVLSESKEDERDVLEKVLFYSDSGFAQDVAKWISSYKNKRGNRIELPKSIEAEQRPILSQLQELHKEKKVVEAIENEPSESSTRAKAIAKIKEKSFKTSVTDSLRRKRRKNESESEAESKSAEDTNETRDLGEDMEGVVFKKGAMLKPFKPRPVPKSQDRFIPMRLKKE